MFALCTPAQPPSSCATLSASPVSVPAQTATFSVPVSKPAGQYSVKMSCSGNPNQLLTWSPSFNVLSPVLSPAHTDHWSSPTGWQPVITWLSANFGLATLKLTITLRRSGPGTVFFLGNVTNSGTYRVPPGRVFPAGLYYASVAVSATPSSSAISATFPVYTSPNISSVPAAWNAGQTATVRWSPGSLLPSFVNINLMTYFGKNRTRLFTSLTPAKALGNTGTASLTLPWYAPKGQYQLLITTMNYTDVSGYSPPFSLASAVTKPAAGDQWITGLRGQKFDIAWHSGEPSVPPFTSFVDIALYLNGQNYYQITSGVALSAGQYTWESDFALPPSKNYT